MWNGVKEEKTGAQNRVPSSFWRKRKAPPAWILLRKQYAHDNASSVLIHREHGNKRRSDAIRGKFGRDLWMICLSYFRTSFFFFFFSFFSLLFHCNGESFLKTCSLIDLTTSILGKIWKRWMEIKFFPWKGILWFFFFFSLILKWIC